MRDSIGYWEHLALNQGRSYRYYLVHKTQEASGICDNDKQLTIYLLVVSRESGNTILIDSLRPVS